MLYLWYLLRLVKTFREVEHSSIPWKVNRTIKLRKHTAQNNTHYEAWSRGTLQLLCARLCPTNSMQTLLLSLRDRLPICLIFMFGVSHSYLDWRPITDIGQVVCRSLEDAKRTVTIKYYFTYSNSERYELADFRTWFGWFLQLKSRDEHETISACEIKQTWSLI